ncbi:hypothetical protein ABMA28_011640 [Loxostege sticticalis]
MAQQTVSRCLRDVTNALNSPSIMRKYIKFPQNEAERNVIKRQFYEKYRLPGVVGCIDCTHVAIVRPTENEERFFNRKHYHSLNVQAICDVHRNILNVDASYGGATHDSFIWSHHEIKAHLESLQNEETLYLLGDSGYPLREYMMTPIDSAVEDSPEGRYNTIQKRARSTIERTFGVLKGRWRCLLAARELHYAPFAAGKIVIACCVLHNLCNRAGLEAPSLTEEDLELERSRQGVVATTTHQALQQGQRARERLVQLLERSSLSSST